MLLDCKNELGECPLWDERDQKLYWVDINGCLLQWLCFKSGEYVKVELPEKVGSFALTQSGKKLLLAGTTTLAWFHFEGYLW